MDSGNAPAEPIEARLDAIEARLAKIENRLGILRPLGGWRAPILGGVRPTGPVSAVLSAPGSARPSGAGSGDQSPSAAGTPGARASVAGPQARSMAPAEKMDLERLLGERVIAWVGALIVVAGVGLFVKLAYDQGWLRFPPSARCLFGGGFGVALVAAGAVLRRKVSAIAGAGSLAAGIGTMFASAFAAYELYALIPLWAVFALLAGISGVGIVIALGSRLVSVGVVAIACAYLTPLLLWDDVSGQYLLPGYLLIVLVSSLVVAARGPARFAVSRWAGWMGTAALGAVWVLESTNASTLTMCAFVGLVWLIVQADLVRASRRALDPMGGRDRHGLGLVSFTVTAWTSMLALYVVAESHPEWDWLAPATIAGACMLGSLSVSRFGAGPRVGQRTSVEAGGPGLGAAFLAQAGGLILLSVGIALSGPVLVLTWLSMGVASAVAARSTRRIGLVGYALVSLGLAAACLLLYEPIGGEMMSGGRRAYGLVISEWAWCMWLASAAWIVASRLSNWVEGDSGRAVARIGLAVGPAMTFLSLLHENVSSGPLAWAWIVLAGAWGAAGWLIGRRLATWFAFLGVVAACAPWSSEYVGEAWFVHGSAPLVHEGLWAGMAMAAVLLGAARFAPRESRAQGRGRIGVSGACVVLAMVVTLAATSFEAARAAGVISGEAHARAAAVSIWWAIFGTGLIAIGFRVRTAAIRNGGLALLYIAGAKVVLFDFAHVAASWRVGAFIGIGLLMLLVGVAYARLSRTLEGEGPGGVDSGDGRDV